MSRLTVGDFYVGGNNLVINSTGRTENKDVHTDGDHVETMMVANHNVLQIDNGVDLKLRGNGKGSLKMQEIVGGTKHTIVQHDAKKVVENSGASGKETVIHDLKDTELKLDAKNVEERVCVESGDAYVLKAENSVITGKDENVKRVAIRKTGIYGSPNTKTAILSASDNAEVNIDSTNSEDCIRGNFDKGSKVHVIEATKGARVKRKATNSKVKIEQE